jgi:hypothetical protein
LQVSGCHMNDFKGGQKYKTPANPMLQIANKKLQRI